MSTIVNAGPLIALGKLGLVYLLPHLYRPVHLPPAVYTEVVRGGLDAGAADALVQPGANGAVIRLKGG